MRFLCRDNSNPKKNIPKRIGRNCIPQWFLYPKCSRNKNECRWTLDGFKSFLLQPIFKERYNARHSTLHVTWSFQSDVLCNFYKSIIVIWSCVTQLITSVIDPVEHARVYRSCYVYLIRTEGLTQCTMLIPYFLWRGAWVSNSLFSILGHPSRTNIMWNAN